MVEKRNFKAVLEVRELKILSRAIICLGRTNIYSDSSIFITKKKYYLWTEMESFLNFCQESLKPELVKEQLDIFKKINVLYLKSIKHKYYEKKIWKFWMHSKTYSVNSKYFNTEIRGEILRWEIHLTVHSKQHHI